ncbi:Metallopeptidase, catalytic domain protein [Kalmanozyma brasiliensis GHG001]|uniref:Putative peptidase domain-containing protein n=1 Tax=Kalmanozyma brasiliensis (strain GHG001) TaxID=1365824 RepID=V5GH91_KALBG|nr:Metallopeptidase, catalytic domain protein [Kalmanozyma brasiliensis GHG001]EST05377.1 Metallopeptidase, catalytic domain protein [Kalmanozyma brasiliensis GHG001]
MHLTLPFVALLSATSALAAPFSFLSARDHTSSAYSSFAPESSIDADWRIHESCNGTQRAQLSSGISDMKKLGLNSIHYILNHPNSEFFTTYFGASADPAPVLGYFMQLVYGDKGDALLRCDNPDNNCRLPEWNGHWRGNNATAETVICDLSFFSRRPLEALCGKGFQLAQDNPSVYFGADLMHRAMHVPEFMHEKIHHYSDSYEDVLELAKTNSSAAVSNQHSLQYFALDVYSRKLTKWGCVGEVDEVDHSGHAHASTSSSSSSSATASAASSTSASAAQQSAAAATPTQAASADCHTHADGSVHCGTH